MHSTLDASREGVANGDSTGPDASKTLNGSNGDAGGANNNQSANSPLTWLADVALAKDKRANSPATKSAAAKNGKDKVRLLRSWLVVPLLVFFYRIFLFLTAQDDSSDVPAAAMGSDGDSDAPSDDDDGEEGGEHFSTLRELLIRPAPKTSASSGVKGGQGGGGQGGQGGQGGGQGGGAGDGAAPTMAKRPRLETLEDVISCVIEHGVDRDFEGQGGAGGGGDKAKANKAAVAKGSSDNGDADAEEQVGELAAAAPVELKHFIRKKDVYRTVRTRDPLPARIMVGSESLKLYPDIPHSWLCSGKLLRLHDPSNPSNYKIFQVRRWNTWTRSWTDCLDIAAGPMEARPAGDRVGRDGPAGQVAVAPRLVRQGLWRRQERPGQLPDQQPGAQPADEEVLGGFRTAHQTPKRRQGPAHAAQAQGMAQSVESETVDR